MKEKIEERLIEEINREFDNLQQVEPGSEEYNETIQNMTVLWKMKNEDEAMDIKREEIIIDSENDRRGRIKEYFKMGVELTGIVLPIAFYGKWLKDGFKFEETGVFTSTTFKTLFQKFKI